MVHAEPRSGGPARGPERCRLARDSPDRCPPAAEPVSNNRVDPSPYYPVFGRRMVMIGYARRPQTCPDRSDNAARPAAGAFEASGPRLSPDGGAR